MKNPAIKQHIKILKIFFIFWSILVVIFATSIYYILSFNDEIIFNETRFKYYIFIVYFIGIVIFFSFLYLNIYFKKIPKLPHKTNILIPLQIKDKLFLSFIIFLCFGLFIFTFYLGFPGYINNMDVYQAIELTKNGIVPIIIPYVLEFLYFLFGAHTYYLFLINILFFYLGICFLICGFYLRFRSFFAILLIFPTFIGNIYLGNFTSMSYVNLYNILFCAYSMIIFMLLTPLNNAKIKNFLILVISILLFLAILWRHNAIFSVFPIFFLFVYLLLKNRNLDSVSFVKYYCLFIVLSAILSLAIVIFIPKALNSTSRTANHIFLHQMAGACVKANDNTCFKEEWYILKNDWDNVKNAYFHNLLFADIFNGIFIVDNNDSVFKWWISAIMKYPKNYLEHEFRFFKAMWFQDPNDDIPNDVIHIDRSVIKSPYAITQGLEDSNIDKFPLHERNINFSPTRFKIYSFIYSNAVLLNHIYGIALSFILMIGGGILLCFKKFRNEYLFFSFSIGFASFWSAFFIAAFSPVEYSRYMSPILPLSIISFIGFIAFILEYKKSFDNFQKS